MPEPHHQLPEVSYTFGMSDAARKLLQEVLTLPEDERLELALRADRDAVGIELSRELRRILAPFDVRDLCRRDRDDLVLLAAAIHEVEVVEVAARRSDDQYPGTGHE